MEDTAEVNLKLEALEARLARIEQLLSIPQAAAPVVVGEAPEPPLTTAPQSESLLGTKLLGAVALFCFFIAGSYFVKLAIDSGWLTPMRQFWGVMLFGGALSYLGLSLKVRHGQYAGFLAGAGLVLMYLGVFAANTVWLLFSPLVEISALTLVSLVGLFLFRQFGSGAFMVATCIATYLIPIQILGSSDAESAWGYFLIWDLVFALLSYLWRDRNVLILASYSAIIGGGFLTRQAELVVPFEAIQFGIFFVASLCYSILRRSPLTASESWNLFPALLLFYGVEFAALSDLGSSAPILPGWFGVLFVMAVVGSTVASTRVMSGEAIESLPMVGAFAAIVFFHAGYVALCPSELAPWLGLGVLATLAILQKSSSLFLRSGIPTFVGEFLIMIEVGKLLLNIPNNFQLASGAVLPLLYGGAIFGGSFLLMKESGKRFIGRILGNALIMSALANISHLTPVSSNYTSSLLWSVYAVSLMSAGFRLKELAQSSLWIFAIVAFKVLLIDSASAAVSLRIGMLVAIGAIFYVAGQLYARMNSVSGKTGVGQR